MRFATRIPFLCKQVRLSGAGEKFDVDLSGFNADSSGTAIAAVSVTTPVPNRPSQKLICVSLVH
jgi:hypothetical protein